VITVLRRGVHPVSRLFSAWLRRSRVSCLNADPAFSLRANVSDNIQSARVGVIHRVVAVPTSWIALGKLAAPRATMGDAFAEGDEHKCCRFRPFGLHSQRLYQLQHARDLIMG